jgi:hypothetical protein
MIKKSLIKNVKALYLAKYGIQLKNNEVKEITTNLLNLMQTLLKPTKE